MPESSGSQNKGGRPPLISDEKIGVVVRAIRAGATHRMAAEIAGIHLATYYRWGARGRAHLEEGIDSEYARFCEQVTQAVARVKMAVMGGWTAVAVGEKDDQGNWRRLPDWRAAEALAKLRWGHEFAGDSEEEEGEEEPTTLSPGEARVMRDELIKDPEVLSVLRRRSGRARLPDPDARGNGSVD